MKELADYSVDFDPDMKWEDFSRKTLIDLLELYGKLYLAVDGFWYLAIKNRVNNEEALACDKWVWERAIKYELDRVTRVLNIKGDDVATVMKTFQVVPWFWNVKYSLELINRNQSIVTITQCPTLESLEKEGEGREKTICHIMEPLVFRKYGEYFNPDIEVKALKLPPRSSKDEICCRWEFKLEPK